MFKVISAEIKKMLSKPGIYILAILLATILTFGAFIYKPTDNVSNYITLRGNDIVTKYSKYLDIASSNSGEKLIYDKMVDDAVASVKFYTVEKDGQQISHSKNVSLLLEEYDNSLRNYLSAAHNDNVGVEQSIKETLRPNLINSLKTLNNAITNGINSSKQGSYAIVTTNENNKLYSSVYQEILTLFQNDDVTREEIATQYQEYKNKYEQTFLNCINELYYPTLNSKFVTTITIDSNGTKLNVLKARLQEIDAKIVAMYNQAKASEEVNKNANSIAEFENLANLYFATAKTFAEMVKYELISAAFKAAPTTKQLDLAFLSNTSEYNANSLAIRYNYMFEHNKTDFDYAHPLTIGTSSNTETNAYDYAYFILKLFSFILIIYAIMAACQTIAGEMKEGSLRYFAIRPVSRNNVLFGKMLAILLLSIIMIIFSTIVALCVGGAVYSFNSLKILTIFNGSVAVTIHPLCMILIYLLSFILELSIYLSIAMLLSCLLRSDLLALTIVMVVYLVNFILPIFVPNPNSWLAFYPFSHISLYSLFGSSVYSSTNSLFSMLLGTKVYAGTNIGLTITVIALLIVVINILSAKIFKKKEL